MLPAPFLALLAVLPPVQGSRPLPPGPHASGFQLIACSLGCVRGLSGFSCAETEVHENEELRLTFNRPVALASASPNSFQLFDTNGSAVPGLFLVPRDDPRTLVFRPQLLFDSAGNPLFGLTPGRVYLLSVPGRDRVPTGPVLTSLGGSPNRTTLRCVLTPSLGVADAVPGRAVARIQVEAALVRHPVSGEPLRTGTVAADGATDVLLSSPIDFGFDDLMNPATLANPVTGNSTTLRIFLDQDGDVTTRGDQVLVPGHFQIQLDAEALTTRVRFLADGGLPPAGDQDPPRRIVVQIAPQVADLAGNPLQNPGTASFTTAAR